MSRATSCSSLCLGSFLTRVARTTCNGHPHVKSSGEEALIDSAETGRCLARGYLNAQEADDARFVYLHTEPGRRPVRAYRTGDRARRDQGGLLEFLGRIDDQANISGHRAEPREVEAALRPCAAVLDAAVAVHRRDGAASLAAWAVLAPGGRVDQVTGLLRTLLPPYMIPTVTAVPRIPMNASARRIQPHFLVCPSLIYPPLICPPRCRRTRPRTSRPTRWTGCVPSGAKCSG